MTTPATAQVMLWAGGTSFERVDVPLLVPADGELLVRLTAATVCGSDRHTVAGRRPGPCPSVLGHEGVGIVVSAGVGAEAHVGDRIIWSVTAPCGTCDRCERGLTAKCRHVLKAGHEPWSGPWPLSGSYASHILLRHHQPVAQIPEDMPDAVASVAACAAATVMAAMDAGPDLIGRRVLVTGAGMLGLLAIQAARAAGASQVVVKDPDPGRRKLACSLGAVQSSECLVDAAFDFSGVAAAVSECIASLDIGGTAVLVGSVSPGAEITLDPEALVRGWHTVTGVHNYEPRHLQHAVDFLHGPGASMPWDQLLSAPLSLGQVGEVFQRPPSAMRDVLRMPS